MKEIEIIKELGYRNWMLEAAGEAVVLGYCGHEPSLEMLGTELNQMLTTCAYDHDDFAWVQAKAQEVIRKVAEFKYRQKKTVFLDEICEYRGGIKRSDTWEYDFIMCDGRYQLSLILPNFWGRLYQEGKVQKIEKEVGRFYTDPSFESYRLTRVKGDIAGQPLEVEEYFENEKMQRRIVRHTHEDGITRGYIEIFYFDDLETASAAWGRLKEIATSDQKK